MLSPTSIQPFKQHFSQRSFYLVLQLKQDHSQTFDALVRVPLSCLQSVL